MDRSLLLDDTSLGILSIGLGSLFAQVHALDDGTLLLDVDLQDFALLTLAVAGVHVNRIPFLNM